MRETTALGAAIAAGFAIDIWKEFEELKEQSEKMYRRWTKAVEMSKGWLDASEDSGDHE